MDHPWITPWRERKNHDCPATLSPYNTKESSPATRSIRVIRVIRGPNLLCHTVTPCHAQPAILHLPSLPFRVFRVFRGSLTLLSRVCRGFVPDLSRICHGSKTAKISQQIPRCHGVTGQNHPPARTTPSPSPEPHPSAIPGWRLPRSSDTPVTPCHGSKRDRVSLVTLSKVKIPRQTRPCHGVTL